MSSYRNLPFISTQSFLPRLIRQSIEVWHINTCVPTGRMLLMMHSDIWQIFSKQTEDCVYKQFRSIFIMLSQIVTQNDFSGKGFTAFFEWQCFWVNTMILNLPESGFETFLHELSDVVETSLRIHLISDNSKTLKWKRRANRNLRLRSVSQNCFKRMRQYPLLKVSNVKYKMK